MIIRNTLYSIRIEVVSRCDHKLRSDIAGRLSHRYCHFFLVIFAVAAPVANNNKIEGTIKPLYSLYRTSPVAAIVENRSLRPYVVSVDECAHQKEDEFVIHKKLHDDFLLFR